MNLTDKEEDALVEHGQGIRDILLPKATELAKLTNKTVQKSLMRLLTPYIKAPDGREKTWKVVLYLWALPPDGDLASGELVAESEPPSVKGFVGVIHLVRSYIEGWHDTRPTNVKGVLRMDGIAPFAHHRLTSHLEKMRPALSRGGGSASTRWYYVVDNENYMLQADISRVN